MSQNFQHVGDFDPIGVRQTSVRPSKRISIPYAGSYWLTDERDEKNAAHVRHLIDDHDDAFSRKRHAGHITASAFVVDAARSHTLLTLHAGLGCWLQLGGHCDGIRDPKAVALREAQEESGLTDLHFASPDVFDIDIHVIPASSRAPAHLHYDIRYLMVADMTQPLCLTEESRDLAWVSLSSLEAYTDKPSVLVIKRKLELS